MSDGHQAHQESVGHAIHTIGELQERLATVTEAVESAMGAVIMAVGQNPNVESSQNAMNFIAAVQEHTNESYGLTNAAIAELERYGGGF